MKELHPIIQRFFFFVFFFCQETVKGQEDLKDLPKSQDWNIFTASESTQTASADERTAGIPRPFTDRRRGQNLRPVNWNPEDKRGPSTLPDFQTDGTLS